MAYHRSLGQRIQRAREERHLTQEELAATLGCSQSALSNYELGKRRVYLATLEQIAQILDKPLAYFTESDLTDRADDGVVHPLSDPLLRELLVAAADLSPEDRKMVLDFVNWRRGKR